MSINAVKGVEIGDGFDVVACAAARIATKSPKTVSRATMRRHSWRYQQRAANHCPYGAEPTSSITVPGRTINRFGEEVE